MAKEGISIREFARRDGVSDTLVHQALKAGHLEKFPDGSMDPDLVGSAWRLGNRTNDANAKAAAKPFANTIRKDETPEDAADRIVNDEGRAPHSLAEAERIKENYLAMLRQLEYDQKSGAVVAADDVAQAVAGEYAVVRNRLLSIPAEVAPRVAILKSAEEVQAFLAKEVAKVLEGLTLDGNGIAAAGAGSLQAGRGASH
jgi:hypothetical protein